MTRAHAETTLPAPMTVLRVITADCAIRGGDRAPSPTSLKMFIRCELYDAQCESQPLSTANLETESSVRMTETLAMVVT